MWTRQLIQVTSRVNGAHDLELKFAGTEGDSEGSKDGDANDLIEGSSDGDWEKDGSVEG